MSVINNIIGKSNFELVRSRIASILADEFSNQIALNEIALNTETDPIIRDELNLNIGAIPERVWDERSKRPTPEEYTIKPLVNVLFGSAPLDEMQTVSTQSGDDSFIVEVYAGNREPTDQEPDLEGDSLASIKVQRCTAIIRAILMNPNYQRLGFDTPPYFIGKVSANNLQVSQPNDGADNSNNLTYGRINLTVKISETVEQIQGTPDAIGDATYKLHDTEKGYYWTNNN